MLTVDEMKAMLFSRVRRTPTCYEWTGGGTHGYGVLKIDGKPFATHRLSWELHNGPIPPGLVVCHKCDNRRCVRPDHLFLGTRQFNNNDRHRKGRDAVTEGERNGFSKLTDLNAVRVRFYWKYGPVSPEFADDAFKAPRIREFAADYGVTSSSIRKILLRRTWTHLDRLDPDA